MNILINKIVCQAITGNEGKLFVRNFADNANKSSIVAGVSPGSSGEYVDTVPIFDNVEEAIQETAADTIVCCLPAIYAAHALLEAIDSAVPNIICLTDYISKNDMIKVNQSAKYAGINYFGPNPLGIVIPSKINISLFCEEIFLPGNVGIISIASFQTSYLVIKELTKNNIGQNFCIGSSVNNIHGFNVKKCVELLLNTSEVKSIVIITDEHVDLGFTATLRATVPIILFDNSILDSIKKRTFLGNIKPEISSCHNEIYKVVTSIKQLVTTISP